ncbi:MAG: hypothetical protein SFY95_06800 [Planctomycetota bacterium]|nr:hypothetical protein [Planctomycetota bacterium]
MPPALAHALLAIVGTYAGVGIPIALALAFSGLHRFDPAARGAGIGFRLLITPGLAALWPWALWRWWRARASSEPAPAGVAHRRAHARAWLILAPVLAALLVLAFRATMIGGAP